MLDLLYGGLILFFLLLSWGFLLLCQKLMEGQS